MGDPLVRLSVRDLQVHFPMGGGFMGGEKRTVRAVDGVSFDLMAGETYGLVGESGCGKSTTARAILGLEKPTSGEIWLGENRIDQLSSRRMQPFRRDLQMIFQDPFASLNPRMTVSDIVSEPMIVHRLYTPKQRRIEVAKLMDLVGLNPKFLNRYPHEFSGGQRQRIGIARALAVMPKVLVCDESVSALDVSIQAQIINLLMKLQKELDLTYLFIAHDLAVVRHISTRVGVMYLGRIVETAESQELYNNPKHPYTQALLSAAPVPDPSSEAQRKRIILTGEVPSPDRVYPGCPFADRCPIVEDGCRTSPPPLEGNGHRAACFKVES
jgi:oligopeptide transport system ATP-binding protein